jgi:prepilin peptidase CpaA
MIAAIALGLFVCLIAAIDIARQRISNMALLALAVVVVVWMLFTGHGPLGQGPQAALSGAGLALVLTLPGHLLGGLGAGDVKLAVVLGAVLGPWPLAACLLVAALVLGVHALLALRYAVTTQRIAAAPALAAGFCTMLGVSIWGGGV